MRATMWRSEAARHGFPAIILDNARNADQVRALLPSNGGCGQLAQSRELLEQAVLLHRTIGDRMGEADGLRSLGQTHAGSGDRHAAHASWEQAALIYQDIGSTLATTVRRSIAELTADDTRSIGDHR